MANPLPDSQPRAAVPKLTLLLLFMAGAILSLQIVGFVWMFSMSGDIKEIERQLNSQEPRTKIIQLWKRGGS